MFVWIMERSSGILMTELEAQGRVLSPSFPVEHLAGGLRLNIEGRGDLLHLLWRNRTPLSDLSVRTQRQPGDVQGASPIALV
jgi:hypothetical protein